MKFKIISSLVFLLFNVAAFGQETVNNASVSGRVTDPSGAVVSQAKVTARQMDTNLTVSTETNAEGLFRFPYLRVGRMRSRSRSRGLLCHALADADHRLCLRCAFHAHGSARAATEVQVTEQSEAVEAARTQIAGTVPQAEVRTLPLNGRNFLDLALLVPGVSPTNTASNQLFAETSAVPGQGISVGSQRNFSNSFIVDGLSNNDDAAGLTGAFYGLDVVNEFQVVTSGGQAEFGRALGGYINMVTKSGTNALHGDLYGYFRNQRLNADNALSNTAAPAHASAVRSQPRRPHRPRPHFLFREL